MQVLRKSTKFGNYLHYNHQAEAAYAGKEQILTGYQQVQTGIDEATGEPILGDGPPIYEDGDDLFAADWDDAWGEAPTDEELAAWEEPEPESPTPLTDVEIATNNFRQARLAAPAALDSLKGAVWAGLVAGGLAPDEATAAGVGLVLLHGPLLAAFEAAGGHPVAGAALYAAIASPQSVEALPWLTAPILAIFAAALAPS